MNKYDRGKIYRIVAADGTQYIGSTIDTLMSRFGNHRRMYTSWKAGNVNRACVTTQLFDKYGVENCNIELIENFPCGSKKELDQREGEIIKANNCINKVVAGRSGEEYRKDKKEELNQKSKAYYEENKNKEIERVQNYYRENTETRKQNFTDEEKQIRKDQKKKWREENVDKIKDQKRKWNEANRDKINARKRELRSIES